MFVSPFDPVEMAGTNVAVHLLERIERYGDRTAYRDADSGAGVSFAVLGADIRRGAAVLRSLGLEPGDVVAVMSPNTIDLPGVLHAVTLAGGVLTTLNPLAAAAEVRRQIDAADARVVICAPVARAAVLEAAPGLAERRCVLTLDLLGDAITPSWHRSMADVPLDAAVPAPLTDPERTLYALPFSSGTSGSPKGVRLTHANVLWNLAQNRVTERVDERDRVFAVVPMFHIYGLSFFALLMPCLGAEVIVQSRFDADGFVEALARFRVTRAYVAPPVVLHLAKRADLAAHDLSALRWIVSGAAPLDRPVVDLCEARLGVRVKQGYGMTEMSCTIANESDAEPGLVDTATVGRLMPGLEARLVDEHSGRDAPAGAPGELWLRGPTVMAGYLGTDGPGLVDDGWFRTGDIVSIDADQRLRIVDRMKELIKYNGFQVAPSELEALLIAHPGIVDAGVGRAFDDDGGEFPKAWVVRTDPSLDADDLMRWIAGRVAPQKKVRAVEFVDAIPRSPAGKILRRRLGEAPPDAAAGVQCSVAAPAHPPSSTRHGA